MHNLSLLYNGVPLGRLQGFKQKLGSILKPIESGPPEPLRGPSSVRNNLIAGLTMLHYPFNVSPHAELVASWVGVLSDPKFSLRWAIEAKKKSRIQKLIAGPNLVVVPDSLDSILCSTDIDKVVVPSEWVHNLYLARAPILNGKLAIWPVGVDTDYWNSNNSKKVFDLLIYEKIQDTKDANMTSNIIGHLKKNKLKYIILRYGDFTRAEYLNALHLSRGMIYLTESESQSISLFEAWSTNIPTLVWDRGFWSYQGIDYPSSSAPYLTNMCGIKFRNLQGFSTALDKFIALRNDFSPREFIVKSHTLEKSAQAYIDLFIT